MGGRNNGENIAHYQSTLTVSIKMSIALLERTLYYESIFVEIILSKICVLVHMRRSLT